MRQSHGWRHLRQSGEREGGTSIKLHTVAMYLINTWNKAPPTVASADVDSDDSATEFRVVLGNPVEGVLRCSRGGEASPHTLHCLVPTGKVLTV